MKKLVIISLILVLIPFVIADLSVTQVQGNCAAGYTNILHLSKTSNAHIELPTKSNFNYSLCVKDSEGISTITTSSGEVFVTLNRTTGSHGGYANSSIYNLKAYLNADPGTISCGIESSASGSCSSGECVLTLGFINREEENFHVSDCVNKPYFRTVCCELTNPVIAPSLTGGGGRPGGNSVECQINWTCTNWEWCENGIQTRTCDDQCPENFTTDGKEFPVIKYDGGPKPAETRTCDQCTDGQQTGDESDIDCGGACGACEDFKYCDDNSDCASNLCIDEVCRPAKSCKGDAECEEGQVCEDYSCQSKALIEIPRKIKEIPYKQILIGLGALAGVGLIVVLLIILIKFIGTIISKPPTFEDFVIKSLAKGKTKQQITKELIKKGWPKTVKVDVNDLARKNSITSKNLQKIRSTIKK